MPLGVRNPRPISLELSSRERLMLMYASRGLTVNQTATAEQKSPETVKRQLEMARLKMAAKTTCQACCEAIRRGLIP